MTKFEHESSSKCICLNLSGYNFVVGTQKNCLSEKVLLSTHNMLWLNTVNSGNFRKNFIFANSIKTMLVDFSCFVIC